MLYHTDIEAAHRRAAEIAKRAHRDGSTLKQAALALGYVTEAESNLWAQAAEMPQPKTA